MPTNEERLQMRRRQLKIHADKLFANPWNTEARWGLRAALLEIEALVEIVAPDATAANEPTDG